MKLIFKIFLVLIIFVNPALALIDTNAKTAIIIDADTGYVLYEKNPNAKCHVLLLTNIDDVIEFMGIDLNLLPRSV